MLIVLVQVMRKAPFLNSKYWCGRLKSAAFALTIDEFEFHVNAIMTSVPNATKFIVDSKPEQWANALFVGKRWGEMNTNAVESWNNWVKEQRSLPPLAMLDNIRKEIMRSMNDRRKESMRMDEKLCRKPEEKLQESYSACRSQKVSTASASCFEVEELNKVFAVDVDLWRCTCGGWQVWQIPCRHACACIEKLKRSVYDYCDPKYSVAAYRAAYVGIVNPIPTAASCNGNADPPELIRPPTVRAQPGRRRKRRYPSQFEGKTTKCSQCGMAGHNRRTCDGVRRC